ncbi:MAG: GNAT family N-acetyltransferase [Micrococcaceae bacterium]
MREAERADLPGVLAMKLASWREAYGALRDEEFFARAEATLDEQVEHWAGQLRRGTTVWLAEDLTDRIVGMASLERPEPAEPEPTDASGTPAAPGTPAQLRTLYVLAEAQGTGVADALLRAALGAVDPRDSAAPDVVLTVLENNPRAIAFYRRHGFEIVGEPVEMTGPWAGLREIRMVRRG